MGLWGSEVQILSPRPVKAVFHLRRTAFRMRVDANLGPSSYLSPCASHEMVASSHARRRDSADGLASLAAAAQLEPRLRLLDDVSALPQQGHQRVTVGAIPRLQRHHHLDLLDRQARAGTMMLDVEHRARPGRR